MKNKIELKKTLVYCFIVIIISNLIFIGLSFFQYNKYTNEFNKKINMISLKVHEKYPEITKTDLMEILNATSSEKTDFFREYGINLEKESVILENDNYFQKFIILNVTLLTTAFALLMFIFLKYNYSKGKELQKITNYLEEINNKNYKLDIDENTEDELSILKNELYKITVMLKETAENSTKDKIKLKDSLSDISHQLKTPLTSITIMLDNILENPSMDLSIKNEFIKDIKRQVININFLVSSLLKLSKLDACSINFLNKQENTEDIIKESIQNVSALCDLKNILINIKGDNTSKIYCDFKWQVEAITNILKNCVEYSYENSKIDIFYETNEMYSKIVIKDYGKGIDTQELPHIFERFYKGKNSSNESVGIGLALSKSIIEKSNGYIVVESELNKGTEFNIKYYKN